ncbi:MAG: hypothetical protein SGJ09_00315 [Phycisphaerae bacterium]|nr:hypothetical protein [Phycisphaerae bacterium]
MLFHFEHRSQPVIERRNFVRRIATGFTVGSSLIFVSLLVGMPGYRYFEGLSYEDSFINAAMILSGMGPLWSPVTTEGKIFAGLYALYSGLAVIAIAGIVFAPFLHRLLHLLHADDKNSAD